MCRALNLDQKRELLGKAPSSMSIQAACNILNLNRSSVYYTPSDQPSLEEVVIMNKIQDIWLDKQFLGYRRITRALYKRGYTVNHKRVLRLMRLMGIQAIYPKPNLSKLGERKLVYPYLLKGLDIVEPNQVWAVDITYLKIHGGFMYLFAIIDIYSRYIVGWEISNTLDTSFCINALNSALLKGYPNIINCDQGSQFTSALWCDHLTKHDIRLSMDGKGRCYDNIYIERFWRTLKYEEIYLKSYDNVTELKQEVGAYINYYNHEREHQSLGYKTPFEVFEKTEDSFKFLNGYSSKNEKVRSSLNCEFTV